ncbi:MAG: hypothetical protein IPP33_08275 [Flavobacteriales bacterium]|nr:hypothetical protein [Flavobacteriales bacterium]
MDRTELRRWLPMLIALLAFGFLWRAMRVPEKNDGLKVTLDLHTSCADSFQVFWDDNAGSYTSDRSLPLLVAPNRDAQRITFILPNDVRHVQGLRIDMGTQAVRMDLAAIELQGPYHSVHLNAEEITNWFAPTHDLRAFELDSTDQVLRLTCIGDDPYFASNKDLTPLTSVALNSSRPVIEPFLLSVGIALIIGVLVRLLFSIRGRTSKGPAINFEKPARHQIFASAAIALAVLLIAKGIANNVNFRDRALVVDLELTATKEDNFQVFYANKPGGFSQGFYVNSPVQAAHDRQLLSFRMPSDTLFRFLRIDPGNKQDSLQIHSMTLRCNEQEKHFDAKQLYELFKPNEQVDKFTLLSSGISIHFSGNDPFLYSDLDIGEDVRSLWEASGNGPLPFWFGLLCSMAVFAGLVRNKKLGSLLNSDRPVELVTALLFCGLISLPLLSALLPIEPAIADTEKRPLAEEPLLRMHSLLDFPVKYTRYYSDHFGFRKLLFRWNSLFHTYVLRCSSMPDNVVFGKEGFLFLIKPGIEKFYRHQEVLNEAQMQRIAERLDHRKKWLADQGIDYYLFIPPLKATMYPEMLPDKYQKVDDRSELDDLKDYLSKHSTVQLIDMRDELRDAKKVRDIYYTTDIHWNPWGGFIGYRVLMRELLKLHPELGLPCQADDYIVQTDTNDNGDLALQIALNDKLTRVTPMMVPKDPFRAIPLPEEQLPASAFFKYKPMFYQGPDPQAPKLLMFRDSFAVYLMPYLNEHFSRIVYVWTPILIPDIIEKEKPDIVVQEIMEVFLTDLLEDKLTDPL